ncbi:hypothetical protein ECDEC5B_5716 [Escherichia coli DEC5B]|nr:hypothetical protein ECDEC5B_5716 [Escherichia coli DEC5B]
MNIAFERAGTARRRLMTERSERMSEEAEFPLPVHRNSFAPNGQKNA